MSTPQRQIFLVVAALCLWAAQAACAYVMGPSATVVPTLPPDIRPTQAPTQQILPSQPFATATPLAPASTPTSVSQPDGTGTPGEVPVYYVILDDQGASGDPIGCGDSLVSVQVPLPAGRDPLQFALENLLANREQFLGESGLYNALYQSDLVVESLKVNEAGQVEVHLAGELRLGGVCDSPRVQAQIERTVSQLPTVQAVQVWVNGIALQDLLSGQG